MTCGEHMKYENTLLFIDGEWCSGSEKQTIPIFNPATDEEIGHVAKATVADLDRAAASAEKAFHVWRRTPAVERGVTLRKAAGLLRDRLESIAHVLTLEQGKPLLEARAEIASCADAFEWAAEEGRRLYGRVIPSRAAGVAQYVVRAPVGPVAAFTPWNFPASQVAKKLAPALAAGCSVIVKASEEVPRSAAAIITSLVDAGIPTGVVQLAYGTPDEISRHLIAHPAIRKISFTGSVPVGKHLAALSGEQMKRTTMELGGHGPAIVFKDADISSAAALLVSGKYRNAGQTCAAPTRFMVHNDVYHEFVAAFVEKTQSLVVGNGLDATTQMGPLANERRGKLFDQFVDDARQRGAKLMCGGESLFTRGTFRQPTVLANVDPSMRVMNDEPFCPIALISGFDNPNEAVAEANRLPFGLAGYAFTESSANAQFLAENLEVGMLSINHLGLALPETPFGGVKESGYGSEGGLESTEGYLNTRFITNKAY
ncbi:NAD-dependent succinate-semialdehyde dehydrogenase [Bradyrhizobium guangdongense]|uniref:NAD-dependent succinate-semialdehyde dehydrogenase n=4 Tax=Bradyrhizobium TaxID=374 RepID=A0AA87W9B9_9BRAD|nr:NAD-dependent succinate-semialdehyde dehydrogenase [Bradyrhizobium guangdongense]